MTRAGDVGREAENFTVQYLADHGFPHAERRRQTGAKDKGDLTGCPGLMWEVKHLGRDKRPRMAGWMKEVDVQTVHAKADYGILVVKPPRFGLKQAGKFWAVMRWDAFNSLLWNAHLGDAFVSANWKTYQHSNARLTTLGAKLVELDRIPGHEWLVHVPPRVPETRGLAVVTLERIVPVLHLAGYGGNGVATGTAGGRVDGAETGRDASADGSAGQSGSKDH